jgi:hypothetical protein
MAWGGREPAPACGRPWLEGAGAGRVRAEACPDATGPPGLSGAPHQRGTGRSLAQAPGGAQPGGRETPARMAAWARLTGIGGLVDSMRQRPGRLSRPPQAHQVPGHPGTTATPPAAVGWTCLAQGALGQCWRGEPEGMQVYGGQLHPLLSCDALGVDHSWSEAPSVYKIDQCSQTP